jgi:hypothetical protein
LFIEILPRQICTPARGLQDRRRAYRSNGEAWIPYHHEFDYSHSRRRRERVVRLSREWRLWDMFRSPRGRGATFRAFAKAFADERDRWALWLPVCLGSGIAFYFLLDREPAIWMGPLGIAAALAIGVAGRR